MLVGGRGLRSRGFDSGVQLAANLVGQVNDSAHVGNGLVDFRRTLAVVDLFAVQVDLEAALSGGCQRYRDFTVATSNHLRCQAYSLVPVPSSNAVDDL